MRAPAKYLHEAVGAYLQRFRGEYSASGVAERQIFPETEAEALALFGIAVANGWSFDQESGNARTLFGSISLAPIGTSPPENEVETAFGRVGARGARGANSAYQASGGGGTFDDDGVTSWLVIAMQMVAPKNEAANQQMWGKNGTKYIRCYQNTLGHPTFDMGDGTVTASTEIAADHSGLPAIVAYQRDYDSGHLRIASPYGGAEVAAPTLGAATNGNTWRQFAYAAGSAADSTLLTLYRTSGSPAEMSLAELQAMIAGAWVGP